MRVNRNFNHVCKPCVLILDLSSDLGSAMPAPIDCVHFENGKYVCKSVCKSVNCTMTNKNMEPLLQHWKGHPTHMPERFCDLDQEAIVKILSFEQTTQRTSCTSRSSSSSSTSSSSLSSGSSSSTSASSTSTSRTPKCQDKLLASNVKTNFDSEHGFVCGMEHCWFGHHRMEKFLKHWDNPTYSLHKPRRFANCGREEIKVILLEEKLESNRVQENKTVQARGRSRSISRSPRRSRSSPRRSGCRPLRRSRSRSPHRQGRA